MSRWTEFHLAVVYYSGLSVSFVMGVLSLLYIKPFHNIKKITEKYGALWGYNFTTTILIAGLLGGMSVSFIDCDGSYDRLLESPSTAIFYGLSQISYAGMSYAIVIGIWFFILIILHMIRARKIKINSFYKTMCGMLVIAGILWYYNFRYWIE